MPKTYAIPILCNVFITAIDVLHHRIINAVLTNKSALATIKFETHVDTLGRMEVIH